MRLPVHAVLCAAAVLASSGAFADAVTDWNVFADSLNLGPPPVRARATAIMHVAIHDALNSIEPRYESYTDVPRADEGASPEAAVGQAAYAALRGTAPAVAASIDTFYNGWYAALPGCLSAACTAGDAAANAILLRDRRQSNRGSSAVARFWPGGGANLNAVARLIIADRDLDLWQHARLFALLNMAVSDSSVAVFDTKYTYNFWRPVTAIRAGATDGNPLTAPDADWLSYQNTPPYPDYTCGLTNNTGAGLAVLRSYFGTDRIGYTPTTPAGLTRSFESLSEAGAEAVDARVFGGMHFRAGCVRGLIQGGQVGGFVFHHSLRELRPSR